jgi:hypothetical protein
LAEIAVLLVGDARRGEFREACASLEALVHTTCAADLDQAAVLLDAGLPPPELIVLAQSRPGEFSAAAVDRLRRAAPLARLVALLGSWCEGELRTGRPLPGAIRVYWHQWLPRFQQDLERIRRGWCPIWGLPATAGEDERLLLAKGLPLAPRQGLVVIAARQFAMADWLSAACRLAGYATVWLQPSRPVRIAGAVALLWDGDDCPHRREAELERLRAEFGPVPILALLDFPRMGDRDEVLAAGAAALLSKPLLVDDLLWSLQEFVTPKAVS